MTVSPTTVRARALAAADALPPTFPIGTFVAANPLRGLEHLDFEHAAARAAAATGAESFLSEEEYRSLHAAGRITDDDLRRALLRRWPGAQRPQDPADPDVELAMAHLVGAPVAPRPSQVLHSRAAAHDPDLAARLDAMVARWSAGYVDRGQAVWAMPRRELGLYPAWHALAGRDPGLRRLVGARARRRVAELPAVPAEALAHLLVELRVEDAAATDYFRTSLRRLPGWAAAVARDGASDDLVGFLALQLALEHLALGELDDATAPWTVPDRAEDHELPTSIERRSVWQEALELGYRDQLLGVLSGPGGPALTASPDSQVVMCIDVRSEGFRRHLEQVGPHATVGFAGFFGLPVKVADLDHEPVASCPVIVEPRATVREVPDGDAREVRARSDRRRMQDAALSARHDAKTGPAALSAFEGGGGWVVAVWVSFWPLTPRPGAALRRGVRERTVPALATHMDVGPDADAAGAPRDGFTPEEQVRVAHGALTTMGLTHGFAPLVVFCGHRSATTNNPFAAALDCGACAGKAGGPNARALAELLNRRAVRAGLVEAGIEVPPSTWFVAAEHDTTTDSVRVLDRHRVPATHAERLARLEVDLAEAGRRLAAERAADLPAASPRRAGAVEVRRRSADWAEPLPEWGLVRNAAVVVGPRSLTAGRDLGRRVFLHSYEPEADPEGAALAAILSGPLVVGHWISSQYYFSSVDPVRHGAGTKPLHNVVAGIGVHEGPGGDLRVGLPLESVQFAGRRVHEPMRLLAVVHAPRERMDRLIDRNAAVAQLLDNGWVRLVVGGGSEGWSERLRDGSWVPCDAPLDRAPASEEDRPARAGWADNMSASDVVGAGVQGRL